MIRILLSIRLGEKRWTQAHLARLTGISATKINKLYNEIVDNVSLEELDRICEVLECKLSDLIAREESIPPETLARMQCKARK